MKKMFKIGMIAGLLALSACGAASSGTITVADAWVRETIASVAVSAGYARIENGTGSSVRLVGASTPAAGRIEIHTVVHDAGIMRMQPLEGGIEIPSGDAVELRPGGYHLMLLDLPRPLRSGDQVQVTLEFEGREPMPLEFAIRSARDAAGGDHE